MNTNDDVAKAVESLENFEPGFLPLDLFYGVARLVVTPTYVIVPFLTKDDKTYVFLGKGRPSEWIDYPNKYDIPGCVFLATDESIEATRDRLLSTEMDGLKIVGEPTLVDYVSDVLPRGREISIIHWIELDPETDIKELYEVEDLPDDLPDSEKYRVNLAYKHYAKNKN